MTRNPQLPKISMSAPIRVALLTEDPLLRAGLTSLLANVSSAISVVARDQAEVALWDAGTDAARVLDRLPELRALDVPTVAIVADSAHVAPVIAAGARGVVLRDHVDSGLHAALAAVRSGLTVIDTPLAEALVPAAASRAATPAKGKGELTERERQVVQLLSEGLSNKLIADRLGISDHTAKFHVNGVMVKLGASTRTEAVVEAMRRGLIRL